MFFNVSEHTIGVTPCEATRQNIGNPRWAFLSRASHCRLSGFSYATLWRCHDDDADQIALQRTRCVHSKRPRSRARVSCRPVLGGGGGGDSPQKFLLILFFTPRGPRLLPPPPKDKVLQLPPPKRWNPAGNPFQILMHQNDQVCS